MSREALERWTQAAMDLTLVRSSLPVPVHVLMTEAVELVRFCRDYWQPIDAGEAARPGLCQAEDKLSEHVASELLELQYALHAAHTEYLLTIPLMHGGLRARAESVLCELVASIEWLLDDGCHDECDRRLSELKQSHSQNTSGADALGVQIADYAALADQLRPRLAALGRFDMSLIDDAHHLARELREIERDANLTAQTSAALDRRNRMAALLVNRMTLVRASVIAIFRNHPHIAHEAESRFELRRRAFAQHPHSHFAELANQATRAIGA